METVKPLGSADGLTLTVCNRSRDVCRAVADAFADAPAVEVLCGDIFALTRDALVSPANAFGDMDGGIDKAIDDHYDRRAQPAVKRAIAERFLGEMPVGAALVLPMSGGRFPHLIVAPTMRVPGPVADSLNAICWDEPGAHGRQGPSLDETARGPAGSSARLLCRDL